MSDSLPSLPGSKVIRAFETLGFVVDRVKGSHHIMKREGHPNVLSVPVHGNKAVKRGLLRALIRASGFTVEEFIQAAS